jgi:hypothetical protein
MTVVLFVHGTGVRAQKYENSLKLIQDNLESHLPSLKVTGCRWGDVVGTKIERALKAIPAYPNPKQDPKRLETEIYEMALWQQLYQDPLYELRALAFLQPAQTDILPGMEINSQRLQKRLENLKITANMQTKFTEVGLDSQFFEQALSNILNSAPYAAALENIAQAEPLDEYQKIFARAMVAQTTLLSERSGILAPFQMDKELRNQLVVVISENLGPTTLGLGKWFIDRLLDFSIDYLKERRNSMMDDKSILAGDILMYQARGQGIRNALHNQILTLNEPVVLLAHSLGGIISTDLLVEADSHLQQQVKMLITIGSQVPYFYAINALASLEVNNPLPQGFPYWLNIYDPQDFLSFIGENLFGERVKDYKVESKLPFPQSHSAYWQNAKTYTTIVETLKEQKLV